MNTDPQDLSQDTTRLASAAVGKIPELCRMILLGVPDYDWNKDTLKDLASCSAVCKIWYAEAEPFLYHSVYVDLDVVRTQKLCDNIAAQPTRALFVRKLFVADFPGGEEHKDFRECFLKMLPTLLNLQHLILRVGRAFEDLTSLRVPFRLLSFSLQCIAPRPDVLRQFFLSQPSIECLQMWSPLRVPADDSWRGILPRLRSAFLVCDMTSADMEAVLRTLPSHLTDLTLIGPTQRVIATALHIFGPHLRSLRVQCPRWTPQEYPIPFWPTSLLELGDAPRLHHLEVDDAEPRMFPMQDREALENVSMTFPGMDRVAGQIRTIVWRPENDGRIDWFVRFLARPKASGFIPAEEYSAMLLATFPTLQHVVLPRTTREEDFEYVAYTRDGVVDCPKELDPTED